MWQSKAKDRRRISVFSSPPTITEDQMYKKVLLIGLALLVAVATVGFGSVAATQALSPSTQTSNSSEPIRTITVTGTGKVDFTPDTASIYIGVHSEGPDAVEAVASNNQKTEAVKDALVALGVAEKDIQTTNFSIYPQPRYDDKGQPTGEITYMVDNTVYVKVRDLDKVGEILDAAVKAGANSINGISFDLEDKSTAMSEAREKAVKDANLQAQQLADAAGVSLGQVITISTSNVIPVAPIYGKGGGASIEMAASVPVSPGQMTISVDVYMVYGIQ
jgi:uncharacterized protein